MYEEFVVCDLETTGLNPYNDEIIEIGLVRVKESRITESFTSLVKHNKPLPLRVFRLTGLKEEDFDGCPTIDLLISKVSEFIGEAPLVGHNIKFDAEFLNVHFGQELTNTLLDTLELSRLLHPTASSYRLDEICSEVGIKFEKKHRALADALAAAELFLKLESELDELELQLLLQLTGLIKLCDSTWKDFIVKKAQKAAQKFSDKKISSYFQFGNFSEQENFNDFNQKEAYFSVENILGSEGVLSKKLENYEYRPQQVKVSLAIENALNDKKHLLVEAGTGVGKSFAYLVPAVLWSLRKKERVVVSTHTINLQEQLFKKDIPLLRKILEIPFKASILKGRKNYLCLRRWRQLLTSNDLSSGEAFFLARLLLWLTHTRDGDRAELNLTFEEFDLWAHVCADNETCMGARCSWFYNGCFLSAARRKADHSNIIVINHSLLFSNLGSESHILPSYGALVIDEAHHLEDAATEYLGKEVSVNSFLRIITTIDRNLIRLSRVMPGKDAGEWLELLQAARNETSKARESCINFFALVKQLVNNSSPGMTSAVRWQTLRIGTPGCRQNSVWQAVESEKQNFILRFQKLIENLKSLAGLMESWDARPSDIDLQEDLNSISLSALQQLNDFRFIMDEEENYVAWAGAERDSVEIKLCYLKAAPVNVAELLFERLFSTHKRVILTSATMTVNSSFEYFIERTGVKNINSENYQLLKVGSPFILEKQALFCIAKDIPLPDHRGNSLYHDAIADAIIKLAAITGGRTMVLFTSHDSLRHIYFKVLPELTRRNIILLGQNIDGGRNKLIHEFKTIPESVLFGAASFWEGVDLPGDSLKCVIIVRLPFQPPNVPIIEARLEKMASNGLDGFRKLTLPHAVLRFKQGFGRLIRSTKDSGAVIVLDRRVIEKRYGRYFIGSVGINRYYSGSINKIAEQVNNWINNY